MADIDLKGIPDNIVLPMRSAQPRALDWNHKSFLTPQQSMLLAAFQALSFSAKAELTHGMKETDGIPAHRIKSLYMQEQAQKQRGADADALKDTTDSGFA